MLCIARTMPWNPLTEASNARGYEKNRDLRPMSRFIWEIIQDRAVVWKLNRKPYPRFQMISVSVTLSDLAKYSLARSIARSICDSWASWRNDSRWQENESSAFRERSGTHPNPSGLDFGLGGVCALWVLLLCTRP